MEASIFCVTYGLELQLEGSPSHPKIQTQNVQVRVSSSNHYDVPIWLQKDTKGDNVENYRIGEDREEDYQYDGNGSEGNLEVQYDDDLTFMIY